LILREELGVSEQERELENEALTVLASHYLTLQAASQMQSAQMGEVSR